MGENLCSHREDMQALHRWTLGLIRIWASNPHTVRQQWFYLSCTSLTKRLDTRWQTRTAAVVSSSACFFVSVCCRVLSVPSTYLTSVKFKAEGRLVQTRPRLKNLPHLAKLQLLNFTGSRHNNSKAWNVCTNTVRRCGIMTESGLNVVSFRWRVLNKFWRKRAI